MSYDYSENILVQEAAGNLLHDELGWDVVYAYNREVLGENGTLGRKDYKEIVLKRDLRAALQKLNPWITPAQITEAIGTLDPEMNSYDKLLELCYIVHDMINEEIPIGLLAYLYSSQVVTKGDKHLLDRNRFYYRMVTELVDEGQRRGQIISTMPYYEIARIYSMCERAIIYDYCISDGNYNLGDYTRKVMPMLFGAVRAQAAQENGES